MIKRLSLAGLSGLCCLMMLFGLMSLLATNEGLLGRGFLRFGASPLIEREAYPEVARDLSRYLSGKSDTLSSSNLKYSQRETLHLQDVKGLVKAGRALLCGGILLTLGLFVSLFRASDRQVIAKSLLIGAGTFMALLLLLGAVGLIGGFERLFTTFHQVFFTNDLWLLDPGQDIVIGLMPFAFFMWASKVGLGLYFVWFVASISLAYILFRKSYGK